MRFLEVLECSFQHFLLYRSIIFPPPVLIGVTVSPLSPFIVVNSSWWFPKCSRPAVKYNLFSRFWACDRGLSAVGYAYYTVYLSIGLPCKVLEPPFILKNTLVLLSVCARLLNLPEDQWQDPVLSTNLATEV